MVSSNPLNALIVVTHKFTRIRSTKVPTAAMSSTGKKMSQEARILGGCQGVRGQEGRQEIRGQRFCQDLRRSGPQEVARRQGAHGVIKRPRGQEVIMRP